MKLNKGTLVTQKFAAYEDEVQALRKLHKCLTSETEARAEYDILNSTYERAKECWLRKVKGAAREVRSFPMFENMKDVLWTVAEFMTDEGERLEFRRDGFTSIEATYSADFELDVR